MFYKRILLIISLIFVCIISLFSNSFLKTNADDTLVIDGTASMVEIGQKVPIKLKYVSGHPYMAVKVTVYRGKFNMLTREGISKYIDELDLDVKGAEKANETITYRILIEYSINKTNHALDFSFDYKAPHYQMGHIYGNGKLSFQDENPIKYNFTLSESNNTISYEYEKINFNSKTTLSLMNTRYVDLSNFALYDDKNVEFSYASLALKCKLQYSDAIYKDNFTYFDVNYEKENDLYVYDNEYKYYVGIKDGGLYETYTDDCYDELVPLFIPLKEKISPIVQGYLYFYDIGLNHNDYQLAFNAFIRNESMTTNQTFGQVFEYKYVSMTPLEGVKYE